MAPGYMPVLTVIFFKRADQYPGAPVTVRRLLLAICDCLQSRAADSTIPAYVEYQEIIDHLKGLQEQGLAMKFEEARKKRERVAELPDPIRNYVGGVEPGEL
jgi:hypothetical protein